VDGNEGEQKAKDLIPDLIISDIMMPGKDGYSLCKELKQHEKTNHIPILLLTAKSSTKDRMDSWSRGADAYMTKPFEAKELKLRLRKLHEIRNMLREKYQKLALINDRQVLRKESIFLHDLNLYIEEHLQDRTFSIENLAKALYMSRMQLHRKLKAMTNRSASNYVRTFKLYKARPLLKDQSRTIADIAYDVGFEDPGYFTKAFQSEFGETPSQFRNEANVNA
jgi:YesN/AraC family two-component response regulator